MTLVDTSVWLDHLNESLPQLQQLLFGRYVRVHPFIIGEIAMGQWKQRSTILVQLKKLSAVKLAQHDEVLWLIEAQHLNGTGISFIDATLLASAYITPACNLWTRDKRLRSVATRLGIASPLV